MYLISKHKNVAELGSKIANSPKPTDAKARHCMPLPTPANGRPDSALHLPLVNSPTAPKQKAGNYIHSTVAAPPLTAMRSSTTNP